VYGLYFNAPLSYTVWVIGGLGDVKYRVMSPMSWRLYFNAPLSYTVWVMGGVGDVKYRVMSPMSFVWYEIRGFLYDVNSATG